MSKIQGILDYQEAGRLQEKWETPLAYSTNTPIKWCVSEATVEACAEFIEKEIKQMRKTMKRN